MIGINKSKAVSGKSNWKATVPFWYLLSWSKLSGWVASRGDGRCHSFGPNKQLFPPPVTLSFKHRGPDLRRTVVVYPWKWVDTETHLPGGRRSLRSFGWEEKHSVYSLVLGDDTKYSDCARRWNGGILRATLLPFILLKAIACINNTGSCEKSNFCSWFGFLFRQNKQMSVFFTANKPSVSWPRVKHLGFSVNHSTFCLTNCLFVLAAHVSK